jgi:hypothetical protein
VIFLGALSFLRLLLRVPDVILIHISTYTSLKHANYQNPQLQVALKLRIQERVWSVSEGCQVTQGDRRTDGCDATAAGVSGDSTGKDEPMRFGGAGFEP